MKLRDILEIADDFETEHASDPEEVQSFSYRNMSAFNRRLDLTRNKIQELGAVPFLCDAHELKRLKAAARKRNVEVISHDFGDLVNRSAPKNLFDLRETRTIFGWLIEKPEHAKLIKEKLFPEEIRVFRKLRQMQQEVT